VLLLPLKTANAATPSPVVIGVVTTCPDESLRIEPSAGSSETRWRPALLVAAHAVQRAFPENVAGVLMRRLFGSGGSGGTTTRCHASAPVAASSERTSADSPTVMRDRYTRPPEATGSLTEPGSSTAHASCRPATVSRVIPLSNTLWRALSAAKPTCSQHPDSSAVAATIAATRRDTPQTVPVMAPPSSPSARRRIRRRI
jgi:hypothetical protein